ncbi:hypothetical protein R1sor_007932 [Riccia sorocarpa]|uniref:FCP1 homology domain-containing protein n=1 Tax=Riccia sorocarpa TaxID=122646 RepID=A0ABD3HU32_9MARC
MTRGGLTSRNINRSTTPTCVALGGAGVFRLREPTTNVSRKSERGLKVRSTSIPQEGLSRSKTTGGLPLKEVPGSYGLPFFGPFFDKLAFYWTEGPPDYYKNRMAKHNSTVYRMNTVPEPPGFPDPRVIVLLDQKSYRTLFDVDKETGLKKDGKVKFKEALSVGTVRFNFKALVNADPTDPGTKATLGKDAVSFIQAWAFPQIIPRAVIPLPGPVKVVLAPFIELLIHTFPIPYSLVKTKHERIVAFFRENAKELLDTAEKQFGLDREEALHNLMFYTCFNSWGGMNILFPTIIRRLGSTSAEFQRELSAEVRKAIQKNGGLNPVALNSMPLVQSAVYEVFRIEPPVPFQYGRARKDLIIESHDAAFRVKKGEMLARYMPVAHRDPKVFADPDIFDPKRFLGEKGQKLVQYVIWSNGPQTESSTAHNKQCPGKDFITPSANLLVAEIYSTTEPLELLWPRAGPRVPASRELDPRRAVGTAAPCIASQSRAALERLCAEPRESAALPQGRGSIVAALRRAAWSHAALRRASEDMTFTRKTGPKRPVENEATVEVEVTRPKRHVKKPIAPADLPETSQRRGKKRVHEVSPGSPPKRRKPAVQPPPKPAPSKARPKVKAPKRLKRERAESVDAVAVKAVEKERSSEGPWLIKRYYKVDVVSKVQWAYMKPEDILGAFAGISEFHQRRLGLRGVTRQYVPPNVPLCKEWLLSFDGGRKGDCSATVQGQRIVLEEEMFRDAFFVEEELNPPASQEPFPKHVMRSGLEDWFSHYDEKAKRYLAEDCVHEEWRPVFQCIQSFLLAKRRPRSIAGPIIHFVKSALEPVIPEDEEDGDEDTSMGPHPKLLDLAAYQFKCVRDEMCQVKKHLEVLNNTRLRETFVGQVLTHLLIHLGIYKPSPEEDLNDDKQVVLHEDVGSSKRRGIAALRRAGRALAALRRGRWPSAGSCGPAQGRNFCAALRRAGRALRGLAPGPLAERRAASPLRRPDGLEPEMQQKLLHAIQTEDRMDERLNAKKAKLAELERLVALEERLLEVTARQRKEEEHRLETLRAEQYQPRLVDPRSVRRKTLILAFDGLLVSIRTSAEEHSEASQNGWEVLEVKKGCFVVARTGLLEFLEACLREFHLMIWTSRKRAVIDRILRFLFKSKKILVDLAHLKSHIWSREQCLDLGGKTDDVLIVEDEVVKISTNNLMNALVPKRWDLSVETPSSSFLMDLLLRFLTTWGSFVKSTVNFVEETRPWDILPWAEKPMEVLVKWWGPDARKGKIWTDVLFRSCTYEERKSLRQVWADITVRQKSRVESSPRVEGAAPVESTLRVEGTDPIESADPVESAAPVESTTPDLNAAPVAIDQTSAPISSVVDVASVPSTS